MGHVSDALNKSEADRKAAVQAAKAATPSATETIAGDRVKSPSKALIDQPAQAVISGNGLSQALVAHYDRGSMITEQYRVIRTNLLAKFPDRRFCAMITSAEANEGKTVTTLNLALVFAELQEGRTVIVDCDLRKGRMASYLRLAKSPGMVELLRGEAQLKDAIRGTEYSGLDVLPAGATAAGKAGELIGRPELEDILVELRKRYDHVLIDTPPVNMISDAVMLGRHVSGALLVVGMYRTQRESVKKAVRLLHAVNVDVLGMVLTKQKFYIPKYIYRYS